MTINQQQRQTKFFQKISIVPAEAFDVTPGPETAKSRNFWRIKKFFFRVVSVLKRVHPTSMWTASSKQAQPRSVLSSWKAEFSFFKGNQKFQISSIVVSADPTAASQPPQTQDKKTVELEGKPTQYSFQNFDLKTKKIRFCFTPKKALKTQKIHTKDQTTRFLPRNRLPSPSNLLILVKN